MTKEEFIKKAKEYGYSKDEIDDFIQLQEESNIKYEDLILIEKIDD